jgi:hypothetical protein
MNQNFQNKKEDSNMCDAKTKKKKRHLVKEMCCLRSRGSATPDGMTSV